MREVQIARGEESVLEAAVRMRDADVGALVVVDTERRPLGVVTDRDVVLRCVAPGSDPRSTTLNEVMTGQPVCAREATPIERALEIMASNCARRIVVTDDEDRLVGILSLDDLLELLVEEARSIGRLLERR